MTGIDRIARTFSGNRAAFIPYSVLGYPTVEKSLEVLQILVDSGTDLLELGMPFSDPLADGPTIQAATQRALSNDVTVGRCISMVADLRGRGISTPALLMGYINPILAYGVERFVVDSADAGVDGFIVPDLPPEEADELETLCEQHGLALVYLLSPTSPPDRIGLIAERSQGFIYLVSITGVTGARDTLPPGLGDFVGRVRAIVDGRLPTSKPLAVGFGIGSGAQAKAVAELADGVIVGSALVRAAGTSMESLRELAAELHDAIIETELNARYD
jgi:tryptophan synthase alpha chain